LQAVTNDEMKNFATSLTLHACAAATPQQLCGTYGAVWSRWQQPRAPQVAKPPHTANVRHYGPHFYACGASTAIWIQ